MDRGSQFISQTWKAFCSPLGAKVCLSSGYHPQTNGQTEQLNQELEAVLRCVTTQNPASSQHLPWFEYAHNSLTTSATGQSRFEVFLGYQPPLFPSTEAGLAVPSVQHHLEHCWQAWNQTHNALLKTAVRNKRYADHCCAPAPQHAPGQKVWLAAHDITLKSLNRKLSPRYIGPYEIDSVLSSTALKLMLPSTLPIYPTFHVSQGKPVHSLTPVSLSLFHSRPAIPWHSPSLHSLRTSK